MQSYIVGGYVRDRLLGLPVKDRDWVVVGATVEDMRRLGYKQVGKDFPVFLHPETREEYALARTERKTGPGYKGFTVYASPDVTLEQDLMRRDLTINAMAMDEQGRVIDPFGGTGDLEQRLLRHVSPAFAEDPVRILRVARFAARYAGLGFKVAPETRQLMADMVAAGEVDALVPERVWQEWEGALRSDRPDWFFQVLRSCGALRILMPELDNLFGVPQPVKSHPEIDCGIHTLLVLRQAVRLSDDPVVRFAALTHDLGKGNTPPEMWPKHHDHESRSVDLVKDLCRRFKVPNDYRDLAVLVARYHGQCHRAFELKPATLVKLLSSLDAWRRSERLPMFLLACQADSLGRTGFENKAYPQADLIHAVYDACAAIDTRALLEQGYQGQKLGIQLHRLRVKAAAQTVHRFNSSDERKSP